MKKILLTSASVLVIGYFFNTEKPTHTKKTSWEQILDSLATCEVEEMFLLVETKFGSEKFWYRRLFIDEHSFDLFTLKGQPAMSWGRFVDYSTSSNYYFCSECNNGLCLSDEIRVRWHKDYPHVRIEDDYNKYKEFLHSCNEGRYLRRYVDYKKFCLEILSRTQKINHVLHTECNTTK